MKKLITAFVWYFLVYSQYSTTQIGPFSNQSACEAYRTLTSSTSIIVSATPTPVPSSTPTATPTTAPATIQSVACFDANA